MNNIKAFLNHQAISSIYDEFSFSGSEIIEITLHRDEPRIVAKFQTSQKPKIVPKKWGDDYDVVYLSISFIGAENIEIHGWQHSNKEINFSISQEKEKTLVSISSSDEFETNFSCDWIKIESITPGLIGSP